MKTKSLICSLLVSATAIVYLAGCSGKKDAPASHDEHAGHDHAAPADAPAAEASAPQFEVDNAFQQQLAAVFTSYVSLKDAFVASDASQVKKEAASTADALGKVDMKLLSGAAHNDWMSYLTPMQTAVKDIQSGADIEVQRKAFSTLSDNLYKSIKAFGLGGKEAYYEFCPMAFNNEGGYWLSQEDEIRNPYFGDVMLTCGEVKEKLK